MTNLKRALFLAVFLCCIYCVTGHSFLSKTFDQLDSTLSVVYVNDYLTAVVWKNVAENYNLNSSEDVTTLMKQQNLLDIAFIPASPKMSTLWTKLNSDFYQTRIVSFYGFVRGYGQKYHILEDFDMIITSRNLFLEKFRNYQKGSGQRTSVGHLFETSDFKFIDLYPFSVYQVDENAPAFNLSISVRKPSCDSSLLTSFAYEPMLFNSFRIMKDEKTVSDYDLERLKSWNSFNINTLSQKWKEKGLRYMLFFDDPFLIRVDMILLSLNIIILIIISAISDHHVIYFFRLIMFILFCLVSGGSCVIAYLIDKIRSSKSQQVEGELESYLKHQDFRELFREYCVKELSLENYNFFTFLLELKTKSKKKLTIELMDEISKVYLSQNSSFELNISSACRKNFFMLRKRVEDQNVELSTDSNSFITIQDLILIFESEVLANLKDTFSRMDSTNEFKTWLHAFKVQQQNNIF